LEIAPVDNATAELPLRHVATPIEGTDPLTTLLRAAYNEAPAPTLTEEQIVDELATWKKERAARSE
jgi:hypothetical protein